jgi:hypothetical protein
MKKPKYKTVLNTSGFVKGMEIQNYSILPEIKSFTTQNFSRFLNLIGLSFPVKISIPQIHKKLVVDTLLIFLYWISSVFSVRKPLLSSKLFSQSTIFSLKTLINFQDEKRIAQSQIVTQRVSQVLINRIPNIRHIKVNKAHEIFVNGCFPKVGGFFSDIVGKFKIK